jgi:hypothetical protein
MVLPQPTIEASPLEGDFSLVPGGPLFHALRRAHFTDDALRLVGRRVALGVGLCWLPLFLLSSLAGQLRPAGHGLSFAEDVEVHTRFLLALPLLLLAELVVHRRIWPLIAQFRGRELMPPAELPRFESALAGAVRLRNSSLAEAALAVLVFATAYFSARHRFVGLFTESWYNLPGGGQLSAAGWWFAYVSLPIFQFLLARWYFRLAIWALLLFRISRLDLKLDALHPDRCGGLSFLGLSLAAYTPLAAAHGVLIAGYIADRVLFGGEKLQAFRMDVAIALAALTAVFTAPLLLFLPTLARVKRHDVREYGRLAQAYVAAFQRKWLEGPLPADEPLVGTGDIQSLADLQNSYAVAQAMRIVPITRTALIQFVAAAVIPIIPLLFTVMPAEQILTTLLKMAV